MYFTGFADEVSTDLDVQIKVTKELGWKNIETRAIGDKNLAGLSDEEFDTVCEKLDAAGVTFNCYGSAIANWQKPITEPPESSYEEMRKAIPRMQKLGTKMARIMSFAVPKELREKDFFDEVLKRMKVLVKMAEDGGIICVHENCMNWGGLSFEHTRKLVDAIDSPNFKLVFDTGNPVFNDDVRGEAPYKKQSSWEFYNAVKDAVVYIHIKDCVLGEEDKPIFTFGGEGDGDVKRVLKDLIDNGYDGGISMEPHMVHVFHDNKEEGQNLEEYAYTNYVEYGQKMMEMVDRIKKGLPV